MQGIIEPLKKYLTTEEKEKYLNGKRSRIIKESIDRSGKQLPHDMIISLHYNFIRAIDRVKEDIKRKEQNTESITTSGSEVTVRKY